MIFNSQLSVNYGVHQLYEFVILGTFDEQRLVKTWLEDNLHGEWGITPFKPNFVGKSDGYWYVRIRQPADASWFKLVWYLS